MGIYNLVGISWHDSGNILFSFLATFTFSCLSIVALCILDYYIMLFSMAADIWKANSKSSSKEKASKKYRDEYQLLLCDGDLTTDYRNLPAHKRTMRLRFLDLKARVCKPCAW